MGNNRKPELKPMDEFAAAQHKLQEAESNYARAESLLIAARRDYRNACRLFDDWVDRRAEPAQKG